MQDDFHEAAMQDKACDDWEAQLEADPELSKHRKKAGAAAGKAAKKLPDLEVDRIKQWLPPVPRCFDFTSAVARG